MNYHQKIYLVRHGETEWTVKGRHTSLTDIPLTEKGRDQARLLSARLKHHDFQKVFTSPLKRAAETCSIVNLPLDAEVDPDLVEWNYGQFEGLTSDEIHRKDPDWTIFTKGAPGGESLEEIRNRADKVLKKLSGIPGDIALFSSGHFLRVLTSRWIQSLPSFGKHLLLFPASISILGHERQCPAIFLWNDISHLS
ncbi:MAG TPA: histidine phosphatase family protein [Rhabdochlamydiaceae bacterium]|nr:histidine phosphatase family protein [Rhabdochlamydiaceae bacterium]